MATDRERIEQSIAALEAQRPILGEEVVELALSALRKRLQELEVQSITDLEEQRKQVTVLFADVPDLTSLSESLDAEDLSDATNALWQQIDEIILEYGGKIDKHIGQGIMALWGAEHAYEDDPERAVRGALAMKAVVASFTTLNEKTALDSFMNHPELHDSTPPLAVRIGINTGLVILSKVATTQEYTAIGDTVNVASRLQTAAPPDGILISHDTYRHVRGVFDVQALEPVTVKGKTEPLQVYLVQQAKPRAFRRGTRGVEGIETHMIGRNAELKDLQDIYQAVSNNKNHRLVTIVGDVGIGKSRLLHEFDIWSEVQQEWFYPFKGRATQEMQNLPYAFLRDIITSRFKIHDNDTPQVAREKMEQGIAEGISQEPSFQIYAKQCAHFVGQLVGLDFSDSPYLKNVLSDTQQLHDRALKYLVEYFKALSTQTTILMLLEDIHWADDSSLDVIQYLAHNLVKRPLIIICAARPSLFERRAGWGKDQNFYTQIGLNPLSRRDSLSLVDEILQKVDQVPDVLRETVAGNAEGNPFYMEELIKMLIEDGVIVKSDEYWYVEPNRLLALRVPPTLTGILQARFDSLSTEERNTLQRASIIGRVFWDDAVAYLSQTETQPPSSIDTPSALTALRQREMIFLRDASTFADVMEYIFKHALQRDTIYESVLKRDRRIYHTRAAEWLIAHSHTQTSKVAGLIADHYERAGQDELAAEYLDQAAEAALKVNAYHEALTFCKRSLAALPVGHRLRVSSNIQAGEALLGLSEYAKARQYLEEGLALARQYADEKSCAMALVDLGWIDRNQGFYNEAQSHLEESLSLARKINDQTRIARALSSLGWVDIKLGNYSRARTRLANSVELFRSQENKFGIATALLGLGIVARAAKEYLEAETHFAESLTIHREMGSRGGMAGCFIALGENARLQASYTTARSYYKAALEIDREIGDQLGMAIDLGNMGHATLALGDYETAISYYREALQVVLPTEATPFTLDILAGLSGALTHTDAIEQALELAGFVIAHPALMEETRPIVDVALEHLREQLSPDNLQKGLERGSQLTLESLAANLLATTSQASA